VFPCESLGDLARDPLRSRVFRHAKRHPNPSSITQNDKAIKNPERDRWNDKKVDRRDAVGMVAEKGPVTILVFASKIQIRRMAGYGTMREALFGKCLV
jgi:hypothetical protein